MSHDFSQGRFHAGLAQRSSSVALAWHTARGNTPNRVIWQEELRIPCGECSCRDFFKCGLTMLCCAGSVSVTITGKRRLELGLGTWVNVASKFLFANFIDIKIAARMSILAEGAIALPVTLSGGALFAS